MENTTSPYNTAEVYFLRHAQSRFNIGYNEKNSDLSDLGVNQARSLTGMYDIVIVSSLKRAQKTLDLSSIDFHVRETTELCREHRNESKCDYLEDEPEVPETQEQLQTRIEKFKELIRYWIDIFPRTEGVKVKILIISHALFISKVTGLRGYLDNCAIYKVNNLGIFNASKDSKNNQSSNHHE